MRKKSPFFESAVFVNHAKRGETKNSTSKTVKTDLVAGGLDIMSLKLPGLNPQAVTD